MSCCYKQAESQYECPAIFGIATAILVGLIAYFVLKYMKIKNKLLISIGIAILGGFVFGYFSFKDNFLGKWFGWCNSTGSTSNNTTPQPGYPGGACILSSAGANCNQGSECQNGTCQLIGSNTMSQEGTSCDNNSCPPPNNICVDNECCKLVDNRWIMCGSNKEGMPCTYGCPPGTGCENGYCIPT